MGLGLEERSCAGLRWNTSYTSPISPQYLPHISPISPPYLPYISPISPLHLPCISQALRTRLRLEIARPRRRHRALMQLEALVDNLDPDKAGQQTFLGRHDLPLPLILPLILALA